MQKDERNVTILRIIIVIKQAEINRNMLKLKCFGEQLESIREVDQ